MLQENPLMSLLGMLVIIALVLALAWWTTRQLAHRPILQGLGRRGGQGDLAILAQLPLGQGQRIVVVECAERYFLLGVTEHGISLLTELSAEDAQRWKQSGESADAEQSAVSFATLMREKLRR